MKTFKVFYTVIFFILTTFYTIYGQNSTYTIEGVVSFEGEGTVYIFLVNEETFDGEGLQRIVKSLSTEELSDGSFSFTFRNITDEEYGIRCFIDENENGKLDRGLFGPTEPWGMSWIDEKPFGRPKFHQICFSLNYNMRIDLVVD